MENLDITAVIRMALILGHLLAFAVAAAAVAFGDFALFARRRVDTVLLSKAANAATTALTALWISGLAVIWLDTRFDLTVLASKPKLLAKLTIVTVLTLNGIALHRLVFPRVGQPQHDPQRAAILPVVLGAISATTWPFAAFLGVAKALAPVLGYSGFMVLYALALSAGVAIGLKFVRPRLAAQIPPRGRAVRRRDARDLDPQAGPYRLGGPELRQSL
ncbi:MAG: hypothetical protein ACRECD_14875 [Burkholderiaceae bacterium]